MRDAGLGKQMKNRPIESCGSDPGGSGKVARYISPVVVSAFGGISGKMDDVSLTSYWLRSSRVGQLGPLIG
jgi:hypothetical protein